LLFKIIGKIIRIEFIKEELLLAKNYKVYDV